MTTPNQQPQENRNKPAANRVMSNFDEDLQREVNPPKDNRQNTNAAKQQEDPSREKDGARKA